MMNRMFTIAIAVLLLQSALFAQEQKPFRYEKDVVRYETVSRETPPPAGCTMFVGSSTWTGWGKTFEEDFKGMNAVNRGFGGSKISDWLLVMDRLVTPHRPARVLFFCGTNDLAHGAEPDKVIADFKTFLTRLRENNPDCKVYFVSVAKVHSRKKIWNKMDAVNDAVREMCKTDKNLFYVDVNTPMQGESGETKEEYYKDDKLHLNRDGQKVWIPVLRRAVGLDD